MPGTVWSELTHSPRKQAMHSGDTLLLVAVSVRNEQHTQHKMGEEKKQTAPYFGSWPAQLRNVKHHISAAMKLNQKEQREKDYRRMLHRNILDVNIWKPFITHLFPYSFI